MLGEEVGTAGTLIDNANAHAHANISAHASGAGSQLGEALGINSTLRDMDAQLVDDFLSSGLNALQQLIGAMGNMLNAPESSGTSSSDSTQDFASLQAKRQELITRRNNVAKWMRWRDMEDDEQSEVTPLSDYTLTQMIDNELEIIAQISSELGIDHNDWYLRQLESLLSSGLAEQASLEANLKAIELVGEVVTVAPGAGDWRDVQEVWTGVDMVTGENIGWGMRALTGALAILPGAAGPLARKLLGETADAAQYADEVVDSTSEGASAGSTMTKGAEDARLNIIQPTGCFVAGTPVWLSSLANDDQNQGLASLQIDEPAEARTVTAVATAPVQAVTKAPIESVPLGARVPTKNPRPWDYDDTFAEPDSATWQQIDFTLWKPNGGVVAIQMLRPIEWVVSNNIRAGKTVRFRGTEEGLAGVARIDALHTCPPIAGGEGSVVTARIATEAKAEVVELRLTDGTAVRGTPGHAVWSETRQNWVALGDLEAGELVYTGTRDADSTSVVDSVHTIPEVECVYNIEVHGRHVYQIGRSGILVHNNGLMKCELEELEELKRRSDAGEQIDTDRLNELQNRFDEFGVEEVITKRVSDPETRTINLELAGDWPNGATIHITGDSATIHVLGIDTADDLVAIFQAARKNGATKGELFTGKVVNDAELARYLDLAASNGTRFGGRVVQVGPDSFRNVFENLPEF